MVPAYFSLGSNLGERERYLQEAREHFLERFSKVRFSRVYETEPVDLIDQPWFLNQVVEVKTGETPRSLLEWVRFLEERSGRQRDIPKGPRTLDVDILLVGDQVTQEEGLILPHPRLAHRRHVLTPLAELAGDLMLPQWGLSVREALEKSKDQTQVRPYAAT